jgi:coenzyme F420-reducing hydrogenase delta subunit
MNALEDDLAASGKFRVIVPACRPDPCSRSSGSELLKAAYAAGADFLLVGGIHKMSTHCAVGEGRSARSQERPERARQTFTSEGTQIRRGGAQNSSYQTTHYACSLQ